MNSCKHDAIPCTSNCGAQIPRVLMEDHLKYTCPQRRARCEFCNKEFTGHVLEVLFISISLVCYLIRTYIDRITSGIAVTSHCIARISVASKYHVDISASTNWVNALSVCCLVGTARRNSLPIHLPHII